MKFMSMFWRNYGSFYGEHSFGFANRGVCAILGRNLDEPRMKSNGAGKSTIGDCFEWTVFGGVPKGDVADSVVNEEAGGDLQSTVQIADDEGHLIQISRARDVKGEKDGVRVWVNNVEKTKLDGSATQAFINDLLGLDRQVFRAAVYFAQQADFNFAEGTDAERKQILTKVLQLEVLDDYSALLEKKTGAAEDEVKASEGRLADFQAKQMAWERSNPEAQSAQWQQQRAQRLQQAQQLFQNASAELYRLSQGQLQLQSIQKPVEPGPSQEALNLHQQAAQAQAQMKPIEQEVNDLRARYRMLQADLQGIEQRGTGVCGLCKQPISPQHVQGERQRLTQDLNAVAEMGKQRADALGVFATLLQQLEQQRQAASAVHDDLIEKYRWAEIEWRNADTAARQAFTAVSSAQRLMQQTQAQVAFIETEQDPHAPIIEQKKQNLAGLKQAIFEETGKLQAARRRLEHLRFWKTGFGARGLKSYVLDERIGEMTDAANELVRILTGGTIWVRFETQKVVGKGTTSKLSEQFNIRVFRHNPDGTVSERNYKSWSGGERDRVRLGIDFGLASLVASRAKRGYDTLILDEIFQKSLDSSGKEAVADLLQHLAKEKSTILVIDHDVQFQGLFEETVVVEKKNRRSKILEQTA